MTKLKEVEEDYVNFSTATLANKKGYVGKVGLGYKNRSGNYYNSEGVFNGDVTPHIRELIKSATSGGKIEAPKNPSISAPSHGVLNKWLRVNFGLFVRVSDFVGEEGTLTWDFEVARLGQEVDEKGNYCTLVDYDLDRDYDSHALAMEAGLFEALQLIP